MSVNEGAHGGEHRGANGGANVAVNGGVVLVRALDRELDRALRVLGQHLPERLALDAADRPRVPVVDLVVALVAGHLHLVGVDDDDIVVGAVVVAADRVDQ